MVAAVRRRLMAFDAPNGVVASWQRLETVCLFASLLYRLNSGESLEEVLLPPCARRTPFHFVVVVVVRLPADLDVVRDGGAAALDVPHDAVRRELVSRYGPPCPADNS